MHLPQIGRYVVLASYGRLDACNAAKYSTPEAALNTHMFFSMRLQAVHRRGGGRHVGINEQTKAIITR
jgi:hypothetical protein